MFKCKYPRYVKKDKIKVMEDDLGNRCYEVSFDLQEEGCNILVISRAPKIIEKDKCNCLYKRIINNLKARELFYKGIKKVTIINLFSIYEVSKKQLYEEYLLQGKDYIIGNSDLNNSVIEKNIEEADYIVLAWGDPIDGLEDVYIEQVQNIFMKLRECVADSKERKNILSIGKESKKGYPKHCFAWSYRDELVIL